MPSSYIDTVEKHQAITQGLLAEVTAQLIIKKHKIDNSGRVDWGHVGDLERANQLLTQALAALGGDVSEYTKLLGIEL